MRQAIVSIRDEDATWSDGIISSFREAGLLDMEVLSCDWTGGVVKTHVEERVDEQRLDSAESIVRWEEVSQSDSKYVYLLEMTSTESSGPTTAQTDEVLPAHHVEIDDESVTFDISGTQEGISDVIAGFEEADVNLTLHELHEYRSHPNPLESLTERQREVLETAFESGYYDVPRCTSTADVAEELGVDGSTVAEHLQRAERNLITTLLNR